MKSFIRAVLLVGGVLFFFGCAKPIPTITLPDGNAGYTIRTSGGYFSLPAEDFLVFEAGEDTWHIENVRHPGSGVTLVTSDAAEKKAYRLYTEGYDWHVISSEKTLVNGFPDGVFVKQRLNINSIHDRMMVRGEGPGFVILKDSGRAAILSAEEIESVKSILRYWKKNN